MRKASLILSIVPFVVALVLVAAIFTARGYEGLSYLVFVALVMPVILMLVSVVSVILAFVKTPNLALDKAAKIMSVVSVAIFGSLGILSCVLTLVAMSQYSNLGSDVTYHG